MLGSHDAYPIHSWKIIFMHVNILYACISRVKTVLETFINENKENREVIEKIEKKIKRKVKHIRKYVDAT